MLGGERIEAMGPVATVGIGRLVRRSGRNWLLATWTNDLADAKLSGGDHGGDRRVRMAALGLVGFAPIGQAADKPTDPQIAHIAYTAGVIDIEAAKQAIAKSKNKAMVDFANDMVRDHEAVNMRSIWSRS